MVALGDGVSGDYRGVAGSWLMILGIFSKLSQFTTLILLAFAPLGVTLLFGTRRGSAGLSKEGQPQNEQGPLQPSTCGMSSAKS